MAGSDEAVSLVGKPCSQFLGPILSGHDAGPSSLFFFNADWHRPSGILLAS